MYRNNKTLSNPYKTLNSKNIRHCKDDEMGVGYVNLRQFFEDNNIKF